MEFSPPCCVLLTSTLLHVYLPFLYLRVLGIVLKFPFYVLQLSCTEAEAQSCNKVGSCHWLYFFMLARHWI